MPSPSPFFAFDDHNDFQPNVNHAKLTHIPCGHTPKSTTSPPAEYYIRHHESKQKQADLPRANIRSLPTHTPDFLTASSFHSTTSEGEKTLHCQILTLQSFILLDKLF
jgi:hypothetical protein